MPNFSNIVQVGHLCKDPEIKYLDSGMAVSNVSIATNHKHGDKEEVCFIDCEFWGKTAESLVKYMKKGDAILVNGRLKYQTWDDKSGAKRSKHLISVATMTMLGKRGDAPTDSTPETPANAGAEPVKDPWADTTTEPEADENTPF